MSKMIQCPSCSSEKTKLLSGLNTKEIIALYRKHGIETADQFTGQPVISYLHCENCDLKFFNPPVAGNISFYNQLQKLDWYFLHADKTEFIYSVKWIKENDRVLDVGSGRGVWEGYLKKIPGVFYQGIEYSTASIELARNDGVNVIQESVQDHAKKLGASYDVVATYQVLEHIDAIQEFMNACLRCLKPGGRLIIAVPNNDGFIKDMTNNWLNIPPHHINHWNETSLRKLGDRLGLKTLEVHKEKVTPVHKLLFYNIHAQNILRKIVPVKKNLVNISLPFRVFNKISYYMARSLNSYSRKHEHYDGHTIIIVFEKP